MVALVSIESWFSYSTVYCYSTLDTGQQTTKDRTEKILSVKLLSKKTLVFFARTYNSFVVVYPIGAGLFQRVNRGKQDKKSSSVSNVCRFLSAFSNVPVPTVL